MLLWLKALHIIFMVTWFAGLFYLPRLFVYHKICQEQSGRDLFKVMEYKLYYYITTPSSILTVILGFWLIDMYGWNILLHWEWLQIKLVFVVILIGFHLYCGKLLKAFAKDEDQHTEKFYRMINEIPVIPLIVIVIMAVVKPFLG
ncbi:MAG: protoporphyrinogen oxidase HemJ [Gammaproteobacteria bacterium]|nr:protoporphyrinogen oxidase HemJ [Gammaproteobacteria bacterium]